MPSKLRKAIGSVKDQTSISLAKVNNTSKSNLEVLILKATRHDEVPGDERYVNEILNLVSSRKANATSCARIIGRRIGKTRNWIVALKSLMLILRIFQDGDPYFPKEVLHAMKRGTKILNLSTFRDDSHSSPWDYTAFVRIFALYLDERLDCFLTGKLQRRFTRSRETRNGHHRSRSGNDSVSEMTPTMLLDKISFWQKLLDRAIATRPTGAAKTNKLVLVSLYTVVQESFDLYRDLSDGLALLLDGFFHLPYQSCVNAFQSCVTASKQFEDLCSFYDLCKSIGIGRTSEYPSVQKISEELVETLQEFLKDQASFSTHGRSLPAHLLLPAPSAKDPSSSSDTSAEVCDQYWDPTERYSERESEFGSQCSSLEDLMSVQEMGTSPSTSIDLGQFEKKSQTKEDHSASDTASAQDQGTLSATNSGLDLVSLEGWPPEDFKLEQEQEQEQGQQTSSLDLATGQSHGWEIVLVGTATNQPVNTTNGFEPSGANNFLDQHLNPIDAATGFEHPIAHNFFDEASLRDESVNNFFDQASLQDQSVTANNFSNQASLPQHYYNPFLQDTVEIPTIATANSDQLVFPINDMFSATPTFQAKPTFTVQNHDEAMTSHSEDDPFGPYLSKVDDRHESSSCTAQQILLHEQKLWLQNQDKIIAKNMA